MIAVDWPGRTEVLSSMIQHSFMKTAYGHYEIVPVVLFSLYLTLRFGLDVCVCVFLPNGILLII